LGPRLHVPRHHHHRHRRRPGHHRRHRPPSPRSPASPTETSPHPAPPAESEAEIIIEMFNEEMVQAGHSFTLRGITTAAAAAAARGVPSPAGGRD
jgi:hypothetical protein